MIELQGNELVTCPFCDNENVPLAIARNGFATFYCSMCRSRAFLSEEAYHSFDAKGDVYCYE